MAFRTVCPRLSWVPSSIARGLLVRLGCGSLPSSLAGPLFTGEIKQLVSVLSGSLPQLEGRRTHRSTVQSFRWPVVARGWPVGSLSLGSESAQRPPGTRGGLPPMTRCSADGWKKPSSGRGPTSALRADNGIMVPLASSSWSISRPGLFCSHPEVLHGKGQSVDQGK